VFGLKVSDVMSKKLVTAEVDEPLSAVAEKMLQSRVSSVIIISDRKIVGIVTEKDFVKFFMLRVSPDDPVKLHMTRNVITVREDASVNEARNMMLSNNIRHLPVVSRSGDLLGIVTTRDLIESEMLL